MSSTISIGVVQLDPVVGDITGNTERILDEYGTAAQGGADLVVTPELSLIGYPPRDLLHRSDLRAAVGNALDDIAKRTRDSPPIVVGAITEPDAESGAPLYNSAVLLQDGSAVTYAKRLLPTYDVFDERRYFRPGTEPVVVDVDGVGVGLTVCEDAWHDVAVTGQHGYDSNPLAETAAAGADVIVTLAASPFSLDKPARREERFLGHANATDCPVVFVNQIGGNDELIFDGHSLVVGDGQVRERLAGFATETRVVPVGEHARHVPRYSRERPEQARAALCLGLADYFEKTGFERAVIGLSGGIDSSVTAALTTAALGADNVYGVSLPSTVTARKSVEDARAVAANLGIEFDVVPIEDGVEAVRSQLETHSDPPTGIALENLQARVRGDVLMTIANERDGLVLTPDNKSEGAVGYCTLYGDAIGALAPLGDCYKNVVYELAGSFNSDPPADAPVPSPIPQSVIEKPPTAELREGQTDADELPPYEELDPVLRAYIEGNGSRASLADTYGEDLTEAAVGRITRSEFKRLQTPPPLRITRKALGRGWNYPIAAEYDHGRDIQ